MEISKWNNKSLAYVFIFLSIFLIFFFAKPEYAYLNENLDTKDSLNSEQETLKAENEKLSKIKRELDDLTSSWSKLIEKYMADYKEDEIIRYFYDYAQMNKAKMSISAISMWDTSVNELWFKESTINLSVNFAWEDAMISFLWFLLNSESKYKFFINTLAYPIDEPKNSFSLSLPIKVFHK